MTKKSYQCTKGKDGFILYVEVIIMSELVIAGMLLVGIIGVYFLTYILNKNTDAPEGIEPVDKCSTCGTSGACSLSQKEDKRTNPDEECEFEFNE